MTTQLTRQQQIDSATGGEEQQVMPWYQTANRLGKLINKTWMDAVRSVMETGRLLEQARNELPSEGFDWMMAHRVPFEKNQAEKLIMTNRNRWLQEAIKDDHRVRWLPTSWSTLYELQRLPENVLNELEENGLINPWMTTGNVMEAASFVKRALHDKALARRGAVKELNKKIWDEVEPLIKAGKQIRNAQRELEFIASEPLARFLNMKAFNAGIRNAQRALRLALPHSLCPMCRGDRCNHCHNMGWVNKQRFDVAPAEFKEKLKIHPQPDEDD